MWPYITSKNSDVCIEYTEYWVYIEYWVYKCCLQSYYLLNLFCEEHVECWKLARTWMTIAWVSWRFLWRSQIPVLLKQTRSVKRWARLHNSVCIWHVTVCRWFTQYDFKWFLLPAQYMLFFSCLSISYSIQLSRFCTVHSSPAYLCFTMGRLFPTNCSFWWDWGIWIPI